MNHLIELITQFITVHGALGVFIASVLEEVIVPIPSAVIQTGAGFLFLSGQAISAHSVWVLIAHVVIPAATGATLGSLLLYGLVYWGGMPFVKRYGKYFFLSATKLERAKEMVLARKSLLTALCVLRFIPILPYSLITAGAGLIRLPLKTYLWTTFVGVCVRATYLGLIGWLVGGTFKALSPNGSPFKGILVLGLAVLALSVITAGIVLYVKKGKKD